MGSSSTPASHGLLSRLLKAMVTQPGLEKKAAAETRGSHRPLRKGGLQLSGVLPPDSVGLCVDMFRANMLDRFPLLSCHHGTREALTSVTIKAWWILPQNVCVMGHQGINSHHSRTSPPLLGVGRACFPLYPGHLHQVW